MQSRKEQISEEKRKKIRFGRRGVLLLLCAAVLMSAGALARYITSNRQRAELESALFHISSDYLEEEEKNASYVVADWSGGLDIFLYNYEKENTAQISGLDLTYTVTAQIVRDGATAENVPVAVKTQSGQAVSPDTDGSYLFRAEAAPEKTCHVLQVKPEDGIRKEDTVRVTVRTTAPYQKVLQAEFHAGSSSAPEYTAADLGDGTVLVTVRTNGYEGGITVKWNSGKYSPDNTNALMASWEDEKGAGGFPAARNSVYELLFFKNTDGEYPGAEGSGSEIVLN